MRESTSVSTKKVSAFAERGKSIYRLENRIFRKRYGMAFPKVKEEGAEGASKAPF